MEQCKQFRGWAWKQQLVSAIKLSRVKKNQEQKNNFIFISFASLKKIKEMIILFNYCKKWKETAIMNFDFWIFFPLLFCLTILDLFSHDILIFILIFETNHCNYFFSGKSLIRKLQFLTETFLVVSGSNLLSFYSLKIEKKFFNYFGKTCHG